MEGPHPPSTILSAADITDNWRGWSGPRNHNFSPVEVLCRLAAYLHSDDPGHRQPTGSHAALAKPNSQLARRGKCVHARDAAAAAARDSDARVYLLKQHTLRCDHTNQCENDQNENDEIQCYGISIEGL